MAAITQHHWKCEVRSANVEARPPKTISQGAVAFPIRHSPVVIRHLAHPAAAGETALQEMAHLILQVWHTAPLICPKCQKPMRVIAVIDQSEVVEKILRHLGLWSGTPLLAPARARPDTAAGPWTLEPCDDVDPMPDYENVLTD